jgi:hypothetical protein
MFDDLGSCGEGLLLHCCLVSVTASIAEGKTTVYENFSRYILCCLLSVPCNACVQTLQVRRAVRSGREDTQWFLHSAQHHLRAHMYSKQTRFLQLNYACSATKSDESMAYQSRRHRLENSATGYSLTTVSFSFVPVSPLFRSIFNEGEIACAVHYSCVMLLVAKPRSMV